MTTCLVGASGTIELYFYGELDPGARDEAASHLAACPECRRALEELRVIRAALAARPDVSAPPGGDWGGFMARLDRAVEREDGGSADAATIRGWRVSAAWIAMAALLALVSLSVAHVIRSRSALPADAAIPAVERAGGATGGGAVGQTGAPAPGLTTDAAFASLSEQHFERSKLVVLGLASRNPDEAAPGEWAYERDLATTLLGDTRVYRMVAEERGMTSLARIMGDLELVLLQTSMSREPEPATLEQIQSLIRKRDLVTKMSVVHVAGM